MDSIESSSLVSAPEWSESVPLVVRRWMQAKGIQNQQEFEALTQFSLKDLESPFSLKNMDKAVDRLVRALDSQEKICLYADFDMDGTPGLALLIKGLQLCGFNNLVSFQPNRFEHGYGVHEELVTDFIVNHGVSLFVTVDVGITAVQAVEKANQHQVDFIITDHHQQKEQLPEALAIVNPNQLACESNLNHLCGTGVAFYLILALRNRLISLNKLRASFDPKKLLDCYAIGTIADMVPLVRENRILVQHGLRALANTQRPGLRILMERLNLLGKKLSSSDVGILMAPKLNALGRMNSDVLALDLFLENDFKEAAEKVEVTLGAQKDRLEIQKKGEAIIEAALINEENPHFVFQWSEDFYKGVVGLLATKMTKKYNVPSFVGSVIDDTIVGSARAPEGGNLLEALEFASETLVSFGGHLQAAGFELKLDQAPSFLKKLETFFQNHTPQEKPLDPDFYATLEELDKDFKSWFQRLEPYGVGFPLPLIRLDHLFVKQTKVLKEKHLKLVLRDIKGNKIEALWFFADNIEEKRQLNSKRVSVIVEPSINEYMGKESLQVLIRDLEVEY